MALSRPLRPADDVRFTCDRCGKTHSGATERQYRLPDPASLFPDEPPYPWTRICGACKTRMVLALGCGCAYCLGVGEWMDQGWEVTL